MLLVSPEKIADVMALSPRPKKLADLAQRVAQGLPKDTLKASAAHIYLNAEDRNRLIYRIIPEATYKRRRELLTVEESERVERLARIFASADFVFDSADDARQFLITPHALLRDRTPLEVSLTELGARQVEDILWRLFYGIST